MPGLDKTKWQASSDKLTAEFTSGQLVIAICVSLFFMLTCFLLGVLVGKADRSLRTTEVRVETPAPAPAPNASAPGRNPSGGASGGTQTYPRTEALTRQGSADAATGRYTRAEERTGPRVTELAPLPSRNEPPVASEPPVKIAKAPEAQETASPAVQSLTSALTPLDPPSEAEPTASVPLAAPPGVLPTPSGAPAPSPPVAIDAPTSTAARGGFGIQVAAFSGAARKQKGAESLRQLKARAGPTAQLESADDGRYYRVMITGFKDRASANAACAEWRRKPGFTDAFVRPLP
jgi:cell division protein FtsN